MTIGKYNRDKQELVNSAASSFSFGLAGSSVFYFLNGAYNSPHGQRFLSGAKVAALEAPRIAGAFAIHSCLYDTFKCASASLRNKEDGWNLIVASAASGGCIGIPWGLATASRCALTGGAVGTVGVVGFLAMMRMRSA